MRFLKIFILFFLVLIACKSEEPNSVMTNPTKNLAQNSLKDNITKVVEVKSKTGRIWMDRNLGATRAATMNTDTSAYGDLYQWGRGADQHQLRKSLNTTTQTTTDIPDNANFILPSSPLTDWRNPQNINLWQGVNGINNPCPTGYRLPTETEWNIEVSSWPSVNADGAFASPLKFTVAGSREILINNVGISGSYWSSTVSGEGSRYLNFSKAGSFTLTHNRVYGGSIRCIKD
jgi:uncharacterized protein (TIGR02145 family)